MKSQSKQGVVWGGLLILFGILSLVETFTDIGAWIWVIVLAVAGLGVYRVYAVDRSEKWVLILSYALFAVGLMIALITINLLRDEAVATYVLTSIALPFLVAFYQGDRNNWGLLIPAYVLDEFGFPTH